MFLLVIVISAVAGLFGNPDVQSEAMWAERNQLVLLSSLAILLAIVTGIFLVFHWGFRRLYGRYIRQLKNTLGELDEIE
jgi:heme/copper-type cytochrome/quinol oxidase subunit 2